MKELKDLDTVNTVIVSGSLATKKRHNSTLKDDKLLSKSRLTPHQSVPLTSEMMASPIYTNDFITYNF